MWNIAKQLQRLYSTIESTVQQSDCSADQLLMTLFNNMGTVAVVAALVAVALAISWALLYVPPVDPAQLRGRRVVICGASQGIGAL